MSVEIYGRHLPGRSCGPAPDGGRYENIHVGLARRTETIDLVPADAAVARWHFVVGVKAAAGWGAGLRRPVRPR